MECFVNKASRYILYYVDIVGSGEFFSLACNVKVHVQYFFSILCSHKCGIIYTRFHASVLSPSMVFMWWRKMGMLDIFL